MVYVTGDTHGELERFRSGRLRWLSKRDTVIVLGDFGFVWDGSAAEQARLKWLQQRRYTILFVDGTHENFDLLAQYPITQRFGGEVRHLGGNLYYVCRGSVLELEGKSWLCFGGGESEDKDEREQGVNWWPAEMPSEEDFARCEASLARKNHQVDYVLTHDAPSKLLDFSVLKTEARNRLHEYLDKIVVNTEYQEWFFGRYHKNMKVSPKARCVFDEVIPLGEHRLFGRGRAAPKEQ